jgi:ubiquinone/menaquinone biosynthesis C-methylase UbiE
MLFKTRNDFISHYEEEAEVYDDAREKTVDGLWITNHEICFLLNNLKLRKESMVLEVGCGTGRILLPLARKGYKCFGIDPSRQMLAIAEKKDVDGFLKGHLFVGDIESIPFPDNTFDALYTANVLQWLPNGYEKSFHEMHRVAKNNAKVILDFPNTNSLWRIIKRAVNWTEEAHNTFSYRELEISFKKLANSKFIIKSQFSYPQNLFKYNILQHITSFIEKMLPLPMKLRSKFYVVVTKNNRCSK